MSKADERRNLDVQFHLFVIDRDLEDGDQKFDEIRKHIDKKFDEMETRIRSLTKYAVGVLLALLTTSITLLLSTFRP